MQTPMETPPTTEKLSRANYNRLYYQKNKARLLAKKSPPSHEKRLKSLTQKVSNQKDLRIGRVGAMIPNPEIFVLFGLSAMISYCLVLETAAFFLATHETHASAYLKAAVIESMAITFSFYESKDRVLRQMQKLTVGFSCLLTLWLMSGQIVGSSAHDIAKSHMQERIIKDLEKEEQKKDVLRQKFVEQNHLGAARRYDAVVDQIQDKLIMARKETVLTPSRKLILNSLAATLGVRVLLILFNLICIRRLAELFQTSKTDSVNCFNTARSQMR